MDLNASKLFLQQLDGSEDPLFGFRTFQDAKDAPTKDGSLTTTRYGKFDDLKDEFIRLNTKGAGVFYTVNVLDGKGFSTGNVIRVRCVFADLDGAPLEPAQKFKLQPQIIVESSKGRYHCLWLIDHEKNPLSLSMFEPVQSAIAALFNSDKSVKDLPRVLRLPGFFHRKKDPFLVNLVSTHNTPPRYSADEILDAFGLTKQGKQRTMPTAIAQGQRETRLLSFAGAMRRQGGTEESILAALKIENEVRCTPPMEISDLVRIAHSVSKYAPTAGDFIRDGDGKIYNNSQQNINIALEKLNVKVSFDAFANRFLIQREDNKATHLNDFAIKRLWLEADEVFRFRPSIEFFTTVVLDLAEHKGWFHPVQEYLAALKWDGKDRIETWLTDYGGAEDDEYTRAVGRLFLVAAVRRIRKPGCKFDEMLVFESPQGKDKSSAIEALVPQVDWFSDNLPLNSDSKEVIELTAGKWIIEAAELSGMRKGDIEHLKSFLSRSRDTARLAYERMTTERPRNFVIFGTTNSREYLKDPTGNRRFWPVRIPGFQTAKLKKDRDQLWAEAAAREAAGMEIRLDPRLWATAAIHQESRRMEDPWETRIIQVLGDIQGRIFNDDVWKIVGMFDVGRRTQADCVRVGDAMKHLEFEKSQLRDGKHVKMGYVRGTTEEQKHKIVITIEDGEATASLAVAQPTTEWEKAAPVETGGE